jgi:hypothetical protein
MDDDAVTAALNADDPARTAGEARQNETAAHVDNFTNPTMGSVTSTRDTNIATTQSIYYIATAAAEETTRRSPYFIELRANIQADWFRTSITHGLLKQLGKQRMLVLHAEPDVPATTLLRHLAHSFSMELSKHNIKRLLLEFSGEIPDNFNLAEAIERLDEPAILVISQASRQLLGWDLTNLHERAVRHHHVIIAATELPAHAWKLTSHEKSFWQDLAADGLFTSNYLALLLSDRLEENRDNLPASIRAELLSEKPTIGGVAVADVATRLQKPLNISVFVQLLTIRREVLDTTSIDLLVREVAQTTVQQMLKKWYYDGLSRREQLLAIGISFLVGLEEDQCLEHLQRLIHEAWAQRTPTHQLIDRIDFEALLPFFDFAEISTVTVRVNLRFAGQRRMLLEEAFATHRRHIKRALPWLIEVIRTSMERGIGQQEHYSTKRLRDELRQTIGESLSDLGLIAESLVEQGLLDFAADRQEGLNVFVARVLKRWYELGHHTAFFNLLTRWDQDRRAEIFAHTILREKYKSDQEDARDYLRATMVLICTYAATSDKPGDVSENIQQWLLKLTDAAGERTRRYLQKNTIGMLASLHLLCLRDVFGAMTCYEDARLAISQQLARLYTTQGEAVVKVLHSWMKQAARISEPYVPGTDPTLADTLLITVALTLGELPYDVPTAPLSFDQAKHQLEHIFSLSHHPIVRMAVRFASVRQARTNITALDAILTEMTDAERAAVVKMLTDVYLEERRSLPAGAADCLFTLDGREYPVLLFGEPPRTRIEEAVENWITQEKQSHARQLALEAAIAFVHAFDIKENRFIQKKRQEFQQQMQVSQPALGTFPSAAFSVVGPVITDAEEAFPASYNFFADDFVPIFVTLNAPPAYCQIIRDLLPIARQFQEIDNKSILFLLRRKWAGRTDGELQSIAVCLDKALILIEGGWGSLNPSDIWGILRTFIIVIQKKFS